LFAYLLSYSELHCYEIRSLGYCAVLAYATFFITILSSSYVYIVWTSLILVRLTLVTLKATWSTPYLTCHSVTS